jgi:hypothetical protein
MKCTQGIYRSKWSSIFLRNDRHREVWALMYMFISYTCFPASLVFHPTHLRTCSDGEDELTKKALGIVIGVEWDGTVGRQSVCT